MDGFTAVHGSQCRFGRLDKLFSPGPTGFAFQNNPLKFQLQFAFGLADKIRVGIRAHQEQLRVFSKMALACHFEILLGVRAQLLDTRQEFAKVFQRLLKRKL